LRTSVRYHAATHVVHGRTPYISYFIAGILQSPAQVYFFHVSIQVTIQAAHLVVKVCAHHHASARCPEYFYVVVVLPFVFLQVIENPASAEHIPEVISKPTAGTCILKKLLFFPVPDLWLARCKALVSLHSGEQRREPVGCYLK